MKITHTGSHILHVLQVHIQQMRLCPPPSPVRRKDGTEVDAGGAEPAAGGADELDKHLEWIENTDNGAAIEERRNEMFPFLRLLIHLFRSTTINPHALTAGGGPNNT